MNEEDWNNIYSQAMEELDKALHYHRVRHRMDKEDAEHDIVLWLLQQPEEEAPSEEDVRAQANRIARKIKEYNMTHVELLPDEAHVRERDDWEELRAMLPDALACLYPEERELVDAYWLQSKRKSLESVAEELGLPYTIARKIKDSALSRLRSYYNANA